MKPFFHLDPPPGFRGLDPQLPVSFSRRNLPHWRQEGATYFVTFRLGDSLPQKRVRELKELREFYIAKTETLETAEAEKLWEQFAKESAGRTEGWLDEGCGKCVLRDPGNRQIVFDSLQFFDGEQYELGSFVVMPNHVHVLMRPFPEIGLGKLLQSRKRASAREINARLEREGSLWQPESYDRIVRDGEHLWKCLQYIGMNPGKAGLSDESELCWVSEGWKECGWDFL